MALRSKAPNDAVWFRQTIQIPDTLNGYDLTGTRIWFQFHATANGPMPEMIYFNGRRAAMGEDLEPIVLLDDARPGDKVVIAVKLLHTVDVKTFRGATLRVDFAENRPNPEDLAQEFLAASVLLPSLAPGDSAKLNTLSAAIAAVDVAALDAAETATGDARTQAEAKFDASLKAAQSQHWSRFGRCLRRRRSTSPAIRTSTRRGCGRGPKPSTWSGARFRPRCN